MVGERLILIIDEDTISRVAMNETPTKRPQLVVLDSDSYAVPKIDGLKINQPVGSHVLKVCQEIGSAQEDIVGAVSPITARQAQIVKYIAEGKTNKEIAYNLGTSWNTVKNQVSNILLRLNANDRAQAVALSMHNGWISMQG